MKSSTPAPSTKANNSPRLSVSQLKNLMATAAGRRPADVLIRGVDLVNVHLPRIDKNYSVAIAGERIAAAGPDLEHLKGPRTRVIEGRGRLALPGMIDSHTHLDGIFTVREFARHALLSGHTACVTEMAMIANAAGKDGVLAFMDEASGIPMRVFFSAPPLVPPFPALETSAGLSLTDFKKILRRPDVVGVGESYWRPVMDLEPWTVSRFAEARGLSKTLEGHAAGARGANLQAYRAGGIISCHEAITPEEVLERLALGMTAQIREGYIRREIGAMGPLAELKGLDTRRLILATDMASPEMMLKTGIMNELVRSAVRVGFEPLKAIQMVTLNPADYFGFRDLGRLDPGALADIVLADNIDDLNVQLVMVGGRVVAENGRLTECIPNFLYPPELYSTFRLEKITSADLALRAPSGPVRVRAVAVSTETVTREEILLVQSVRGRIGSDPERDIVKAAVFNKHSQKPQGGIGLAKGFGLKSGAVATSLIWDTNNLLCVGVTDQEMALAANRLIANQGGLVVVQGRKILAEMPLPVGGVISEEPLRELLRQGGAVEKAAHSLGCTLARPFLALQTFCFTGLPFLRLTDRGLVDVRKGGLVPVVLADEAKETTAARQA